MKSKHKLLNLFCLAALSCLSYSALAVNETEPNETWSLANVIQLSEYGVGGLSAGGDVDWWRVTSTTDGDLNVWCNAGYGAVCGIYDTLGTIILAEFFSQFANNVTVYGLKAGTYYIKLHDSPWPSFSGYNILPTWTTTTVTDPEPNDSKATAMLKNIGDSITGRVSYYYYQQRDSGDWYKIKPTSTKLYKPSVTTTGTDLWLRLYDSTGVNVLRDAHSASNFSLTPTYLFKNKTYYYRISSYDTVTAGTYTIKSPVVTPNEIEPNGIWNQAQLLALNAEGTGKCAAGGDVDWWRVKSTTDGKLSVTLKATTLYGISAYCEIFDTLGTAIVGGGQFVNSYNTDIALKKGTYYIRVRTANTPDSLNYLLACTWPAAPYTDDVEPNGNKGSAKTFALNTTKTGHSGYFNSTSNDTVDWYKITTTNAGNLAFTINAGGGTTGSFDFLDNNGTTLITGTVTGSTGTLTANGIGKGTWYLRIRPEIANGYFGYQVSNAFTASPVPGDVEPNNDLGSAKVVNLNDSVNGNVGYYYNLQRDTSDWYKLTTTSDGDLRIYCYGLQGSIVQFRIYDNLGNSIFFAQGSGAFVNLRPALGAGTYYIKVNMPNAFQYAPYAMRVTLEAVPTFPNDAEPNGTIPNAITMNQNDSVNGHIGYYSLGFFDIADCYKFTTNNDGPLKLKLYYDFNPLNVNQIYVKLMDTVAFTVLDSVNSQGSPAGSFELNRNNLKKGTYYILIIGQINASGYALKSTFTAPLANDPEPNSYAKNGAVINGYTSKTGHVGYYGNGSYDSKDWWRIGFGGAGNLDVTYSGALNGQSATYKLYADTNAAPIDSQNVGNNYSHTYTGLTAGTYYINMTQIGTNYQDYTLTANYRDTTSATIALASSSTGAAGNCNNGKLTYYVTRGLPPYSVQLYRNGVAYGAPVSTNDTAKFNSLTPDVYYAKVKSTGAVTTTTTSTLKGQVTTVTGHTSSNIQSTSAVVNWNAFTCVDGFRVGYKKTADATFTLHVLAVGAVTDTLKNLLASTSYDYKVQAYVQYNNIKYYSGYTTVKTFITLAPRLGGDEVQQLEGEVSNLLIYPNPAQNEINVQFEGMDGKASLRLIDLTGRIVMEKQAEVTLNQYSGILDISNLQSGIYQLIITDADNKTISTKVVKE